ncbi:MAG: hypothetical protein M0Z28_18260 [Rhodospirillales bacterium]|nr:hypothetical protein [Rhodospirillales bacterium]
MTDSPDQSPMTHCGCERSHNGLGIAGRECDCQDIPDITAPMDAPLTHYETGLVAATIGARPDTASLDDNEAREYMEGYHAA